MSLFGPSMRIHWGRAAFIAVVASVFACYSVPILQFTGQALSGAHHSSDASSKGKRDPPENKMPSAPGPKFSLSELRIRDGRATEAEPEGGEIYLAVGGIVFDVTVQGRQFYGVG